jgi:hypothetical protein
MKAHEVRMWMDNDDMGNEIFDRTSVDDPYSPLFSFDLFEAPPLTVQSLSAAGTH